MGSQVRLFIGIGQQAFSQFAAMAGAEAVKKKVVDKVKPKRTTFSEILLGESRVMCRWNSSLWKLLWKELLVYTLTFLFISVIYRFALTETQQIKFEMLV